MVVVPFFSHGSVLAMTIDALKLWIDEVGDEGRLGYAVWGKLSSTSSKQNTVF